MLNIRRRMKCWRCGRRIPRKASFVTQTCETDIGSYFTMHTCLNCMEEHWRSALANKIVLAQAAPCCRVGT